MPARLLIRAASRATGRLGWLRGAIGAVIGIALAAAVATASFSLWPLPHAMWLMAPVGASAVLVFAVPASPLAQPWPVFGGSILSLLTGLVIGHFVAVPALAAAMAAGSAIAVMLLARCLHPPGGACALVGALAAAATPADGLALLMPLAANLAGLIAAGWAYNTLTGHAWPHRATAAVASPIIPAAGYTIAHLDAVLEDWDEVLDVSREDLDALFRAVIEQARQSPPAKAVPQGPRRFQAMPRTETTSPVAADQSSRL